MRNVLAGGRRMIAGLDASGQRVPQKLGYRNGVWRSKVCEDQSPQRASVPPNEAIGLR